MILWKKENLIILPCLLIFLLTRQKKQPRSADKQRDNDKSYA